MANAFQDLVSVGGLSTTLYSITTGQTTDTAGSSVDCVDLLGNICNAILISGNRTGTGTPTINAKMQESTDGSNNWTDITGGAFTAVTGTNVTQLISYKPTKRYQRSTHTVSGTSPVFSTSIAILGALRHAPANVGGFSTAAAAT